MHELGVMLEVVKEVEKFACDNGVQGKIETLVLRIGELSAMIPHYIEAVYPAAVDGTMLEHTKLVLEIMPANARCKDCGAVFNIVKQNSVCPGCGGKSLELLSGREFFIKEIAVRDG
jgi:hydrogenase nickel incorporation protein HypA/HybF